MNEFDIHKEETMRRFKRYGQPAAKRYLVLCHRISPYKATSLINTWCMEESDAQPVILPKETAREIWDAALKYRHAQYMEGEYNIPVDAPDFETFYQQLTEQKEVKI